MRPRFNEQKTTQIVSVLLDLRGTRTMHYLKMIKLLYHIDREALKRWGRPLTYDYYVSMNQGPVLSNTLRLITEESEQDEHVYWRTFISDPQDYQISLLKMPDHDELSKKELELVNEIYRKHGYTNRWELVKQSHDLPEWHNPDGSAIPIDYRDILRACGKTEIEIEQIIDEIESLALFDSIME